MKKQSGKENLELKVSKLINAPIETVFDAWTKAEHLKKWWGPNNVTCFHAEVDFRVGGKYRIGNRLPDGNTVWIFGVFEVIKRPQKLVFTWNVEPGPENIEKVSVDFIRKKDKTEVLVHHERILNKEVKLRHQFGWIGCLDGLSDYLGPNSTS